MSTPRRRLVSWLLLALALVGLFVTVYLVAVPVQAIGPEGGAAACGSAIAPAALQDFDGFACAAVHAKSVATAGWVGIGTLLVAAAGVVFRLVKAR